MLLIHAQAQNKAKAWKVVHYSGDGVRTYNTKPTDQRVKPLFKLVAGAWVCESHLMHGVTRLIKVV